MKKAAIIIFFFCGFQLVSFAQSKHEITLGYGIGSTDRILSSIAELITTELTAGTTSSNSTYSGPFHLGYKYSVSDNFSLGGTILYESKKADGFINNEPNGHFNFKFFTLAAEGKYKYINNDKFSLYGLLGLGGTNYTQDFTFDNVKDISDSKFHPNFQLTPIGVKFGNKISLFIEAGLGYKGILCTGLAASF